MDAPTIRQQLITSLDWLDDEQIGTLLAIAEKLLTYDEANDPAIGLFSGPPDLAERAEDILLDEIDLRSGTSQHHSTKNEQ